MGKFKKLYFYFIIAFSLFIYVDNVNAYSMNYYEPTVTFKGSVLTTQNFYIADSAQNNNFRMYNKVPFEDLSIVPAYGLIGICTTGIINNISSNSNQINNLQLYKTQQICNLNNTPNYAGKITYITFSIVQGSCSVQGTNCTLDSSIGAYWNEGGYVQLLNAYYSNDPFIYDSSLDTIINNNNIINNSINDANNKLNDINGSINNSDTTGATNDANNFFNNFTTDLHGLTGIITAPLNAINSLTNKTCSPLVLPLPFVDKDLTLPCMRSIYDEHFGAFMTLYDTITFGIVSYWVCVRIFSFVKDFKNPEHDEIEVVDL